MVPRDFEAWRDICASFVGEAMQLARRAIPWADHFEQSEWEDIRRFVLMVKDYGFRPWADAWGEAPALPKFDCALLKKWDAASRKVPLCVKTFASHVHWVQYGELEDPPREEDWREPEEEWKVVRERQEAKWRESHRTWLKEDEGRRAQERESVKWKAIACALMVVPLCSVLNRVFGGASEPQAQWVRQHPAASCVDICVARCNALG